MIRLDGTMGSGINMQASIHNLTQAERLQQDAHKLPIAHQVQNALKVMNDAQKRLTVTSQADTIEGKNSDSKEHKKVYLKKKRVNKRKTNTRKDPGHAQDGLFIDCDA